MKITVFNGSPRAELGNTHIMIESLLEGAREASAECENIFLAHKKIHHCLGCFKCWTETPGICSIKDDMAELLKKFESSDIIFFATPLYVDNVTGIMKNFMDRLIPIIDPHFEFDGLGESRHVRRYGHYPKYVIVSNCGFPEQNHFQVLRLLFKRLARNSHSEVIAEIYRGGGELLRSNNLLLKPIIWNYKRLLKKAGRQIVENQQIPSELYEKLEAPLISHKQYLDGANKYWNKKLDHHSN
jgi:multimeric flavodoxin WrbA